MATVAELENRFTYHPPRPGQPLVYEIVRRSALQMALLVHSVTIDCREQDLAFYHLEAAVMFANAAIARQPVELEAANLVEPDSTVDPESPAGRYAAYQASQGQSFSVPSQTPHANLAQQSDTTGL